MPVTPEDRPSSAGRRSALPPLAAAVAVSALLGVVACNGDDNGTPLSPSDLTLGIEGLISGVEALGAQATLRPGIAPSPAGGPSVIVSGNPSVINGGTLSAALAGTAPFQTVFVHVSSRTVGLATDGSGGIDGYYELRLPSPQTASTAVLALAQSIPLSRLDVMFAVANPAGLVGPYASLATTVTSVGTGDVQVTLSWDADSDVDLHVVDPAGEEVFYGRRRSASGGELDLDSNAGCAIDGVRNENITWPVGRAPRGAYIVRVDYWSSCGVARTNYTVRVNNGGSVQIFTGSFTGAGDQGGLGSGRLITTFERLTGPTAASGNTQMSPSGTAGKTLVVQPR